MKLIMMFILGRKERLNATYTGEMMDQLFAAVDRALWRWHVPLR
jgi:hypothetical protein